MKAALVEGIDINALYTIDDYGYAAQIHMVSENGKVDIAQFLLDNGANVSAFDRDMAGDSQPLHLAARAGHPDIVKLLLDNETEKDRPGLNDCTPLGLSLNVVYPARAAHTNLETMKLLVEYGCDINKSRLVG